MRAKVYYHTTAEMEIDIDECFVPILESCENEIEIEKVVNWIENDVAQIDPNVDTIIAIHGIDFDGIWEY